MSRQRLILTLVVGLLLLALGYAYWATPRQQKVAAKAVSRSAPGEEGKAPVATTASRGILHLDLLEREKEDFPGSKRDLFSLRKPPLPPPPMPPPMQLSVAPLPPLPPPMPPGTQEAGAVARALGQFTFLGFLQKDGAKTLFLSSQGEIFVVKKGNAFGKQKEFVITEVSAETLTIRQANGPGSMTVSLVEQRPLTPVPDSPQPARVQRPGFQPMTIQPLPEDLARQTAEGGVVETAAPEELEEEVEEEIEGEQAEEAAPMQFGPRRLPPPAPIEPEPNTPTGAPTPTGLQFPGMN